MDGVINAAAYNFTPLTLAYIPRMYRQLSMDYFGSERNV